MTWGQKRGGGGAPPPLVPQLTPTEFSPWGQWSLTAEAPATGLNTYLDRSGNARTLSGGGTTVPDLRPSPARAAAYQPGIGNPTTVQYGTPYAGVSIFAGPEFTFTVRSCFSNYYSAAADQVCIGADGYKLLFKIYGNGRLSHLPYSGAVVSAPTLNWLNGDWAYYSVRRLASGAIRFGINGTFETVASPQPAVLYARVTLGKSQSFASDPWLGPSADMNAWSTALSDADIKRFAGISMGKVFT